MKQITAKRAIEALYWLHNNAHHEVGCEWPRDKPNAPVGEHTHIFYRNHLEKLRVPIALMPEVSKHIRPNKRKFDTRMYALTRSGREMVR